jgi:hypothetical protein
MKGNPGKTLRRSSLYLYKPHNAITKSNSQNDNDGICGPETCRSSGYAIIAGLKAEPGFKLQRQTTWQSHLIRDLFHPKPYVKSTRYTNYYNTEERKLPRVLFWRTFVSYASTLGYFPHSVLERKLLLHPLEKRSFRLLGRVERLMLLFDIMISIIINMDESSLDIRKSCYRLAFVGAYEIGPDEPSSFLCRRSATSCVVFSLSSCPITMSTSA